MRKLVAGNWKMNGTRAALAEVAALAAAEPEPPCDVLICPPATLIAEMAAMGAVPVGAQDCHAGAAGAHTGDLSAEMLADAGAVAVILGHSERRADHGETSEAVAAKVGAVWRAGLTAIVCVGETEAERDAGRAAAVVSAQVSASIPDGDGALVLAYEPVWAIGTGRTPSLEEIAEMHGMLRAMLPATRLLYGGSVKPSNAAEIFAVANVDGALVGGASLRAADFGPIIAAAG
ncbi:MAG: triose-phosphate isomerase [Pseudomonadota bacterium]